MSLLSSSANIHEEFDPQTSWAETNASRRKIVRQDRLETSKGECILVIDDTSYEVANYSPFGVAVYSLFPINRTGVIGPASFYILSSKVGEILLQLIRQEPDSKKGFKIAFEIVSEPLNINRALALIHISDLLKSQKVHAEKYSRLPEHFQFEVYQIKEQLEKLEQDVNNLSQNATFTSIEDIHSYEDTVIEEVGQQIKDLFTPIYGSLEKLLRGLNQNEIKLAYDFFRSRLNSLLYQSPLSERCVEKPLGYAGDYEMMNLIYRNENIGQSLFARAVHRYFLEHPEAQSVRNRASFLYDTILSLLQAREPNKPFKILSVASGPAIEVQNILQKADPDLLEQVEFHLLDQDLQSLKHAQKSMKEICIERQIHVKVQYIYTAIKHVIARGLEHNDYQLIYAAGLFDYFSDPVAKLAGKRLFQSLAHDGKLVIGNFNIMTPNKFLMEMALDWHLLYRSEDDLKQLFGNLTSNFYVEKESENINLFCVLKKL